MLRSQYRRVFWVAAAALIAFSPASEARSQTKAANKAAQQAAMQAATAPLHTLIAELRHTHTLLAQANHDYQGHRAKAHGEVGRAIHLLTTHPHHHHKHPALTAKRVQPKVAQAAVHEPQQISDAQMQQAGQQLQVILTQIATLQNNGLLAHPNVVGAGANIQQAIQHVQTALSVSPLNTKR
jgi:hypothetical protein